MSNKNYRYNSNDKFKEFDDDFEDYGYDVKNIRRQSKKKVTKFKTKDDEWYDSFWTGTLISQITSWDAILHLLMRFLMLTSAQLDQLIDNYAERIVDEMDVKCLMQFVYDTIVENMAGKSEEDVLNEISYVYDEDVIQELVESVTVE